MGPPKHAASESHFRTAPRALQALVERALQQREQQC
jgi:hypothetical protein